MLAVVCPITSKSKKYPFEMPIPRGLKVKGVVLTDQIKCIDWTTRDLRPLTRLPAGFVDQVSRRVSQLIS